MPTPPTVSLTMIVRNEEANLPGCLASCADLFDELVIVDTGSTDRTKDIAAAARDKHGRSARVFDFEWCDDFAAARNESVRRATGEWVFRIDADERLPEITQQGVEALLVNPENFQSPAFHALDTVSTIPGATGVPIRGVPQARLVPHSLCRWEKRLHESIAHPVGIPIVHHALPVLHLGCSADTSARDARNLRIAEKWASDCPRDPEAHFALAVSLGAAGRHADAIAEYGRVFTLIDQKADEDLWLKTTSLCGRCAILARFHRIYLRCVDALDRAGSRKSVAFAAELRELYRFRPDAVCSQS